MEEKLTEYIKTNSYQTKITEELSKSLHKEVWQDLMEFVESVKFINWLIQPENIRGYASDRPRDKEGKIIIDITKPHILKDMDFFRERALFYKKHGRYTHLRPNPNPKSEYAQFWKEEMRRWKHGVVRESDGEWIPGLFYFYLNYSPIWLNEEESKSSTSKKSKGVRKREFPKVWLGDYLFFHYVNQARQSGAHAKLLKCRGVGFEQPYSEVVKTSLGDIKVGDVKVGDKLIDPTESFSRLDYYAKHMGIKFCNEDELKIPCGEIYLNNDMLICYNVITEIL